MSSGRPRRLKRRPMALLSRRGGAFHFVYNDQSKIEVSSKSVILSHSASGLLGFTRRGYDSRPNPFASDHLFAYLDEYTVMMSPDCVRWSTAQLMRVLSCAALCVIANGCVSAPYRYGSSIAYYKSEPLANVTKTQIERGQPRPFVDGVGWVVGIPSKIVLWNRHIDNHNISPETEEAIAAYLASNDLTTVKVRLNQYAPGDEWQRLVANDAVGWGWRYTLGATLWLGETVFPGRVIGGDHYNPFTNTISIFSDVPAVAIHEGGHAKDFARRYYKGTYAAGYLLPVTPLWYEAVATNDALSYLRAEGTLEDEQAADRVLYPAYGTYLGDSLSTVVPAVGTPLYVAGVLGGHLVGQIQARRISDQRPDTLQHTIFEESTTITVAEADSESDTGTRLIRW